jgi:signal transduction histidine kinase
MLKNLKVGTKLVAILLAPVLVLMALAVIGVKQRLADASDAKRVEELTGFSKDDAVLVQALQLEGIYSAVYASTNKTQGKQLLDEQRKKTDAAQAAYEKSRDEVQPGNDSQAIKDALKQADNRLKSLPTIRRSVDAIQTEAPRLVEDYNSTTSDLLSVNRSVAQSVNDPALSRGLNSFVNLSQVTNAEFRTAALLTISVEIRFYAAVLPTGSQPEAQRDNSLGKGCGQDAAAGGDDCKIYKDSITANTDLATADKAFEDNATGEQKQRKRFADAGLKYDELKRHAIENGQGHNSMNAGEGTTLVAADEWVPAAVDRINKLTDAQIGILSDPNDPQSVASLATSKTKAAQNAATLYALFSIGAILLAAFITFLVARAITVPLRKLTSAAYVLSTERLPALVERLRNPEEDTGESLSQNLSRIDINSKDEIGQLADSFNSIQQVTVEVAEEQSVLLRKGIGDIFINLARRNQTLLDRQIEFIDQLEANEEDPDQLDNLFKLDHLATRMRRNAESLLVLAGAEPPRRRGRPVALADVVRVAIGEVEDFARIQLLALDDATVGGNVAVDLAHLLSELMENATHFSPPDTMVEIVGHRGESGYIISVSDQGIGMSADQLSEANTQLARPPLVGLALSRSLGFIVIGRLAQRFEISVKLTASPSGGVTALVTLPSDLVTFEGEELPPPAAELTQAPAAAAAATEEEQFGALDDEIVVLDDELVVLDDEPEAVPVAEVDEEAEVVEDELTLEDDTLLDDLVEEGISESDEFDRGLQAIISDELAPGPVETETPVAEAPVEVEVEAEPEPEPPVVEPARSRAEPIVTVAEQIAAASRIEAKEAELTAAGLVKRTPKKKSETATFEGATTSPQQARTTGSSQRSPEEVRKMLSRYRSGLNKGRGSADSEKTDS